MTPHNPAFAIEAAGMARTDRGLAIGGVRHEFRDEANGFHARLSPGGVGEWCQNKRPGLVNQTGPFERIN